MKREKNKLNEPKQPQTQPVSATKPAIQKNTSVPAQAAVGNATTQAKAATQRGHKKWMVLLLVFFLFGVALVVPARYVPGLSGLLQRLGLSAEESQQTSAGRALQAWLGGADSSLFDFTAKGNGKDSEALEPVRSVFDTPQGADRLAAADANGGFDGSSALFDLRAVNTSKRARGEAIDAMVGATYRQQDEDEVQRVALSREPLGWSAEALAAQNDKTTQDIYFGADGDVQARAAFARENIPVSSIATGKVFADAGVVGVAPVQWFEVPIGKAVGLREVIKQKVADKAVEKSTGLINYSAQLTAGTKAEKDLAYAWLFSSMAEDAKQLMLKKQLSSAGYMAMDVPSKIYDVEGNAAGLALNPHKVAVTVDLENKQLLSDEQCRQKMMEAGERMQAILQKSGTLIDQVIKMFPSVQSCPADPNAPSFDTWIGLLGEGTKKSANNLADQCKDMDGIFSFMQDGCKINSMPEKGNCVAGPREEYTLKKYADDLKAGCYGIYESSQKYKTEFNKFITSGNKKKLEEAVKTAQEKHDDLVNQYNEKEKQLKAEEAKPEEEQDVELIAQLTDELNDLKGNQIPAAKETLENAKGKLESAKQDFKKVMDEVNNKIYTVYGSKGGTNGYDKVRKAPEGIEETKCEVADADALANQLKQEDVIASFNLAVSEDYLKQAEAAGRPFATWNPFFSTIKGSVDLSEGDNAAGKDVLLQLLEQRK